VEFLVEIEVRLPPDLPGAERTGLLEKEQIRGRELKDAGTIVRIWRIPGRTANVGVWSAADATGLHEALTSLPVFPYAEARVTPLATHFLEDGPSLVQ
jgi:muconolactone D-isomerase